MPGPYARSGIPGRGETGRGGEMSMTMHRPARHAVTMVEGALRALDLTMPTDRAVERLIDRVAPGADVAALGGSMGRNLKLTLDEVPDGWPPHIVLHVFPRYVTRSRLIAVQRVRACLGAAGLRTAVPLSWLGSTVLDCGAARAEIEPYLLHQAAPSHEWLFAATGELHRALARISVAVPRPLLAFHASPSSLRRGIRVTRARLGDSPQVRAVADTAEQLIVHLRRCLPAASTLPAQLVHGDVTADNVVVAADGSPIFLDFGFTAWRPRIHDLAFALVYEVFQTRDGRRLEPEEIAWDRLPHFIAEYERTAIPLTYAERSALGPYAAALLLYFPATGYFVPDAAAWTKNQPPGLRLATWLLDHRSELFG
ncbi:MAG: phosphotransferase [Mycobacterium sp.]|nr:phosphotransferase [Mycobacterium sp.]